MIADTLPPAGVELLPDGARLLLIYDGWCGVCTRAVEWVRARDPHGRVAIVPNQQPGLLERTGLTRAQVDRSVWVIDRGGRRYEGAAAVNRTLDELGGVWRPVGRLGGLAPIRRVEAAAYRWFAANRARFGRWGSTPACSRPGVECLPAAEERSSERRGCCGGARSM
jgi:predicted DCC family thiol-disulfide oxidoreductase YuxK